MFKLLLLSVLSLWAQGNWEELPVEKIEALKQPGCTFVHVWANWCEVCRDELPSLVRLLGASKKIHPVIVDVSRLKDQENFSKPFLTNSHVSFKTYFKPEGEDGVYMSKLVGQWGGQLPVSVLYDEGKEKHRWVGALGNPVAIVHEIEAMCK